MKLSLATLLSFNGGYVDAAGFLALHGLFTAHVTGNFVTFAASMVYGTSGAAAKLLALPVFCLVVILVRLLADALSQRNFPVLRCMLMLKFLLLLVAAIFALRFGPFESGDEWQAILTGMTLVSAMAIQNTVHRVHLATAPPTTVLTGTTTQIMIDIADLLRGMEPEARSVARRRLARMGAAVGGFACGCAVAALLFLFAGMTCFLLPPLMALTGILVYARAAEVSTA